MPGKNTGCSPILWGALLLIATLSGGATAAPVTPASWEVASEFYETPSPASVWRYGSKPTANGAFTVMTNQVNAFAGNIKGWDTPASVLHNVKTAPYVAAFGGGSVTLPAHGLTLHPGQGCQYAVVRFIVPTMGKYRICGQFFGIDSNSSGTTTDVLIYHNNVLLFNSLVDQNGSSPTTNFAVVPTNGFSAGDTIDFESVAA